VNPPWRSIGPDVGVYSTEDGRIAFAVSFDVAVTISESGEKEGGGKITVAKVANLGGKVAMTNRAETVTRLQFGIPIAFPEPKNGAGELKG
jgi:hypothetical protein